MKDSITNQTQNAVSARGQRMAHSLSYYARQLNFENRTRRHLYKVAGLTPRFQDRFFALLLAMTLLFIFVIPVFVGSVYFAFVESEIYKSEVRFVLRSATPLLSRDRFGDTSLEPDAKIIQDTQIVVSFLETTSFLNLLDKQSNLSTYYTRDDIDFLSRLKEDYSHEDLLKYWERHYEASIHPKSGIVTVEILAYKPTEARHLLETTLTVLEARVNELNEGIWSTLTNAAKIELEEASQKLKDAHANFTQTQNELGIFDVDLAASSLTNNLGTIEGQIAELRAQRISLSGILDQKAPRLNELNQRIKGLEDQAQKLRSQSASIRSKDNPTLADSSNRLQRRQLEMKIASDRFEEAVRTYERVQLISSLQLVYIDHFSEPTLADETARWHVVFKVFLLMLSCLCLWSALTGCLILARNKID